MERKGYISITWRKNVVRTVRRTQNISEAQRQDQFQAGEEEICSVPTQIKNGQDLHEEENQNDVTGGKLWEEAQREVLGGKNPIYFSLSVKYLTGMIKKRFLKGGLHLSILPSLPQPYSHPWDHSGHMPEGPEVQREWGQQRRWDWLKKPRGAEEGRRGLPMVYCSAVTSAGHVRKYTSGRKSEISAETDEKANFPTRLEYLKSCSKPKWHNHVSIQLGPDIKYWHDQRNHQQLQQKKWTCKDKAKNRGLAWIHLCLFLTSLLQINSHMAIQNAFKMQKRNSTHHNYKLALLLKHAMHALKSSNKIQLHYLG